MVNGSITGTVLATGTAVSLSSGATTDDWQQSSGSLSVTAGQVVAFVVTMDDDVNFDEAVAEYTSGACSLSANTCCPPLASDPSLIANSFAENQMPGESITQHYGLLFAPVAALETQMQLWAPYALSAYATPGWTGTGIVMWVDMRTDGPSPGTGPVNSAWPPTAADWAAGSTVQSGPLRMWFASGAPWAWPDTLADNLLPKPTASAHMEQNGRRYMAAISYQMYERRGSAWRLRQLCDGALLTIRHNVSMMAAPAGDGKSAKSASTSKVGPLEIKVVPLRLGRKQPSIITDPVVLRKITKNGARK